MLQLPVSASAWIVLLPAHILQGAHTLELSLSPQQPQPKSGEQMATKGELRGTKGDSLAILAQFYARGDSAVLNASLTGLARGMYPVFDVIPHRFCEPMSYRVGAK